ncbi:hypothetical protein MRB53_041475 [Persea americana]|nr:hypothetical protein MRB53_041475 [Persea americana]
MEPSPDGSPPAKRPRLKLNVKPPITNDGIGDTIAVSRSKQRATLKLRNSQTRHQRNEIENEPSTHDSAASILRSKTEKPRQALRSLSKPTGDLSTPPRDGYGDFLSYYVAGCEPADSVEHALRMRQEHSFQSKKGDEPKSSTRASTHESRPCNQAVDLSPGLTTISPHSAPAVHQSNPTAINVSQRVVSQGQHAQINIIHKPMIEFIDLKMAPKSTALDDVATMIAKLEHLSAALTDFGGAPPVPNTLPLGQRKDPAARSLRAFRNQSDAADETDDEDVGFRQRLKYPGIEDEPLTHGVQFIQNALKCWAQQRLSQEALEKIRKQRQVHVARQNGSRQSMAEAARKQTTPIRIDLAETPEGVAIMAFQTVLNSGCLRVNATLPVELAKALRHLHVQIDYLINKGAEHPKPWRCVSYSDQLATHKARMAQWKNASPYLQGQYVSQPLSVLRHTDWMDHHRGGLEPIATSSSQHEAGSREKVCNTTLGHFPKACFYDLTRPKDLTDQQCDAQEGIHPDFFETTAGNTRQMNDKQRPATQCRSKSLNISLQHYDNTATDSEHPPPYGTASGTDFTQCYSEVDASLEEPLIDPGESKLHPPRAGLRSMNRGARAVRPSEFLVRSKKSVTLEKEIIVIDDSPNGSPCNETRPLRLQKGLKLKPTKRAPNSDVSLVVTPSASM